MRILHFLVGSFLAFIGGNSLAQDKNNENRRQLNPFKDAQAILEKEQEFHKKQSELAQKEIEDNSYSAKKQSKAPKEIPPTKEIPSSAKEGIPSTSKANKS